MNGQVQASTALFPMKEPSVTNRKQSEWFVNRTGYGDEERNSGASAGNQSPDSEPVLLMTELSRSNGSYNSNLKVTEEEEKKCRAPSMTLSNIK
jgi:hypothetical protein